MHVVDEVYSVPVKVLVDTGDSGCGRAQVWGMATRPNTALANKANIATNRHYRAKMLDDELRGLEGETCLNTLTRERDRERGRSFFLFTPAAVTHCI